jgi:hypothetical protein
VGSKIILQLNKDIFLVASQDDSKQNKGICSQLVELLPLISSKILILFFDCLPACLSVSCK